MKDRIVVRALWDDEAEVWTASSEDIEGLAIEADTIEHLTERVLAALEDLVELNGFDSNLAEIPVEIRSEHYARLLNPGH